MRRISLANNNLKYLFHNPVLKCEQVTAQFYLIILSLRHDLILNFNVERHVYCSSKVSKCYVCIYRMYPLLLLSPSANFSIQEIGRRSRGTRGFTIRTPQAPLPGTLSQRESNKKTGKWGMHIKCWSKDLSGRDKFGDLGTNVRITQDVSLRGRVIRAAFKVSLHDSMWGFLLVSVP
jgi:hypothetical protein